jgi:AcrR family transcriptional regulator
MVDDTRAKLLDAAGPIFAEQGFRAATVREISTRAGVNLALMNYHFGDKEQLYAAAVSHAAGCCRDRVPLPTWSAGTSPRSKLRDFVHMFLQRVAVDHEPAWHGQLIMREMVMPTRACEEFVKSIVQPTSEMLRGIVTELLPAGIPERTHQLIAMSIVGQILHYWSARPVIERLLGADEFRALDVDMLCDHITRFSLAAIDQLVADESPPPAGSKDRRRAPRRATAGRGKS